MVRRRAGAQSDAKGVSEKRGDCDQSIKKVDETFVLRSIEDGRFESSERSELIDFCQK
jgi:hypothetical protein